MALTETWELVIIFRLGGGVRRIMGDRMVFWGTGRSVVVNRILQIKEGLLEKLTANELLMGGDHENSKEFSGESGKFCGDTTESKSFRRLSPEFEPYHPVTREKVFFKIMKTTKY